MPPGIPTVVLHFYHRVPDHSSSLPNNFVVSFDLTLLILIFTGLTGTDKKESRSPRSERILSFNILYRGTPGDDFSLAVLQRVTQVGMADFEGKRLLDTTLHFAQFSLA